MTAISELVQSLSTDDIVELYQLDATDLGGAVYCFTSGAFDSQMVYFDGQAYTPIEIEGEGFDLNGKGALPRPKLRISNASSAIAAAVIAYNDLIGATLTSVITFRQFLDGQPNEDPTAILSSEIYKVDRKSNFNKVFIEWELAAALDQEGRQLPGRQVLKNNCTWIYRTYNSVTEEFDYSTATCPYDGVATYDANGNIVTDPSQDRCGKLLSSCKLRFGETASLPFGGFPGVGRF